MKRLVLVFVALLALTGCRTPTPPPASPHIATHFGDGAHTPGREIAFGTYTTVVPGTGSRTCYIEVYAGDQTRVRRTNQFGNGGQTLTVHILSGDTYVTSDHCGTWLRTGD